MSFDGINQWNKPVSSLKNVLSHVYLWSTRHVVCNKAKRLKIKAVGEFTRRPGQSLPTPRGRFSHTVWEESHFIDKIEDATKSRFGCRERQGSGESERTTNSTKYYFLHGSGLFMPQISPFRSVKAFSPWSGVTKHIHLMKVIEKQLRNRHWLGINRKSISLKLLYPSCLTLTCTFKFLPFVLCRRICQGRRPYVSFSVLDLHFVPLDTGWIIRRGNLNYLLIYSPRNVNTCSY